MITPKPLASAMMVPTRQITLPTSAGRSVRFAQGVATITDTNDLPYLMARDDVRLMITPYAMSWMPTVLDKTRKINADVHWPPDWEVRHTNEQDWDITSPEPEPEPAPAASPDSGEVDLDTALKGKPRWRRPPAS